MFKNIKKTISVFMVCLTIMSLIFAVPASKVSAASDVTVSLSSTKQSISGFGASSAWCGAIGDSVMNSLYGDLGYSILRLRIEEGIGDNWKTGNYSAWAAELSNAKKASAKGAKVFASPWNPPASMQETFSKSGDSNPIRLRYDKYAEYVQYLNAYVTYMKNNGVNLYAISVQNEPDYANDWTWWTPTEMLNFMKNYAGSINCKVMAPESFQFLKNMSDPILNDTTALANMDILGCHFYGTSTSNMAYPLYQQKGAGKELWMTEKYFDDDTIGNIMNMSKEIHDAMVTGNMNAYVYWWITWPNGLATSSGTIYKRAYTLGQFAKFIRPGYYRVDATANPNTNVYVSAYTGDNKAVIVAINTNTSAVSQRFVVNGGTVTSATPYTTTSSANLQQGSNIAVSNGAFTATLPAQSITTYVCSTGAIATPTPTPVPTVTPTPTPTPTGATSTPTPTSPVATATPTPIPTATPTSDPTGGIKVQFFNGNTAASTNTLYPNFKIVNTGTSAINLSDVKMRYYFTNDGTQGLSFACDYSTAGSGNITGTFTTIAKTNADRYLEVGFSSSAGTLAAGANAEVKGRIWKSDWSNFTQTNDYSFNATSTNYVDSTTVTGYLAGALKWGTEP